jgi:PAS domain S-box-containing protein
VTLRAPASTLGPTTRPEASFATNCHVAALNQYTAGKALMRNQKTDVSPHRGDDPAGETGSEELHRAHERLCLALSATGLGVWERDFVTDKVTWSDAMQRLFGRSPEQLSGTSDEVASFVHPDDRAAQREGYLAAIAGNGDVFEQEFRVVRPDGQVRWVHRRGQVRRGPDGRAQSVLGIALDITERKQAEDGNARLAAIASAADDTIMGLAPDGTILAWNPAAERMFGYTADEAVGQSARMLYPPSAGDEFDDLYRRVGAGEHVRFEGVRLCKDGGRVEIAGAATPVRGVEGGVVGVAAVVRDVGAHKRTEQKLVEALAQVLKSSNQRKLALAAGGMGTFEVDIGRESTTWSDEVYSQLGIDRSVPIATDDDIARFIHPEDRDAALARREEAYRSGDAYEDEFRIVRQDGQVRWLYVRAQALPASDPTHVHGVSMDITERKQREAHIRFLMSEVLHRSRNLLAVVQAMASQTARSTRAPLEFAGDFSERLKGLASSLDLLVSQDWRGVPAIDLVRSQLGHYGVSGSGHVEMQGPNLLFTPAAAQYLGMALHELATNTVKHGALSVASGKVRIEWRLEGARNARRFHMSWVESGGAPVNPPKATGFGRLVIERMVAEALQGRVTLDFAREGLRWHLDADAAVAIRDAGGDV